MNTPLEDLQSHPLYDMTIQCNSKTECPVTAPSRTSKHSTAMTAHSTVATGGGTGMSRIIAPPITAMMAITIKATNRASMLIEAKRDA